MASPAMILPQKNFKKERNVYKIIETALRYGLVYNMRPV